MLNDVYMLHEYQQGIFSLNFFGINFALERQINIQKVLLIFS